MFSLWKPIATTSKLWTVWPMKWPAVPLHCYGVTPQALHKLSSCIIVCHNQIPGSIAKCIYFVVYIEALFNREIHQSAAMFIHECEYLVWEVMRRKVVNMMLNMSEYYETWWRNGLLNRQRGKNKGVNFSKCFYSHTHWSNGHVSVKL